MNRLAGETSPYLLQHAANPVRLVPVGRRGARPGARGGPADPPLDRVRGLPLVPRDGARVVRGSCDRGRDERALREREGRSRGASRPRRRLHGGGRRDVRPRRLADDGLPDAGRRAVLRRHLLPAGAAARDAELPAGARGDRRGLARAARRRCALGRTARRGRPSVGLAPALAGAADGRACSPERRARPARRSSRRSAAGAERRSSRTLPCSSSCFAAATSASLAMAVKTLDEMAAGGMYDLLGGGFHRYSVDDRWLVPHFEKMLYDNALLAPAYLHAWLVTGDDRYRAIAESTIEYLLRELLLPEGGFASAQDADTDGVEGLTFTWTEDEGVPAELLEPFEHGRSIIRGELDEDLRARLFEVREQRPKPLRDDKAIASWNGLALAALAEAGRRLERPDWVDAGPNAGGVPARSALRRQRPASAQLPRRPHERSRLSRRLRERGARVPRAPRRDRRASLAPRGEPARAARDRALRRRRARRLLPLSGRRRAPRRADEGARRPPASLRQLDARARADPALADLRRRRARAPRRSPCCASCGLRSSALPPPSGGRSARSTSS